ncbi:Hypothetical predicted protein [Olea europaea subsp. europaea]|uniref:Uncharacterized protein n=1 Tax=Olea europaea subsp. europaea TaxID=158383 RepID=A0A8S0Q9W7_OLEEU|nr:Hypothetical predicted protein [Olea europaea subsp. europaea]
MQRRRTRKTSLTQFTDFRSPSKFGHMRPCLNSANTLVSGWMNDRPDFCAGPLPNNRSSLHVHATLHPTEVERDLPYIARLVPFPDCPGHDGSAAGDGHDDESGVGAEDDETSVSDDRQTPEGNGDDGSKADESGDSNRDTFNETCAGDAEDDKDASGRQSGAFSTPMVAPSTYGL